MTLSIKICGIMSEEPLDAALEAGAEMIGLVFHSASPRRLRLQRAASLRHRIGSKASVVALTVDANDSELRQIVEEINPDWVQLHGTETSARVSTIKTRFGLPAIKAVAVKETSDVGLADAYRQVANMILFDAKPPAGARRPGGHGVPFDWTILGGADRFQPFVLSGGLNVDNVRTAIAIARPAAVDVSSGVETAPGQKDPDLIRAFIAAARVGAEELQETVG